jgi:hypothetical protein
MPPRGVTTWMRLEIPDSDPSELILTCSIVLINLVPSTPEQHPVDAERLVTITRPETARSESSAEALIEEARRLRRRRLFGRSVAAAPLIIAGALVAVWFGGGFGNSNASRHSAPPPPHLRASPAVTDLSATALAHEINVLAFSPFGDHKLWVGDGGYIATSNDGGQQWATITPTNVIGDDAVERVSGSGAFGQSL